MFRDATSRHDCFVELHAWRNGGVAQKTANIKYNLYFSFSILLVREEGCRGGPANRFYGTEQEEVGLHKRLQKA